jgi:hypothetical protein
MRRLIAVALTLVLFSSCATNQPSKPEVLKRSFYLNRSLITFEMNNGYCYSREKLPNGGYKNYYRSDRGNIIADLLRWDSYPYCELELITDKNNIVRKITILEDAFECAHIIR